MKLQQEHFIKDKNKTNKLIIFEKIHKLGGKNKMQSYRLTAAITLLTLMVLLLLMTEHTEQRTLTRRQAIELDSKTSQDTNETRNSPISGLQSPFIVLMSSNTISVAQLPMIENGNLTDVYHLVVDSSEIGDDFSNTDEQDESGETEREEESQKVDEESRSKSNRESNADGREYEQQMLRSTTLENVSKNNEEASLGKSEWQQIASAGSAVRDREEVWPQMQTTPSANDRKEDRQPGSSASASGKESSEGERTGPRKRRLARRGSNSLSDGDDGSGNDASAVSGAVRQHEENNTAAVAAAAQARQVNRADEYNNVQNVTSAQSETSSGEQQKVEPNPEGGAEQGARMAAENGDKNRRPATFGAAQLDSTSTSSLATFSQTSPANTLADSVRFCDFDVHMTLGYAFVADSTGRIHRFKLPSASSSSASSATPTGRKKATTSDATESGENDYTNTINASGYSSSAPLQTQSESKLNSRTAEALNNAPSDALGSNSIRLEENNHHNHQATNGQIVEDETAGKPKFHANKVSSGQSAVAHYQQQSATLRARQHPTTASGGQRLSPTSVGAPTSGAPLSLAEQLNSHEIVPIDGLEPRIIWSRNRFASSAPQQPSARRTTFGMALQKSRNNKYAPQLQQLNGPQTARATPLGDGLKSHQMGSEVAVAANGQQAGAESQRAQATAAAAAAAVQSEQTNDKQVANSVQAQWSAKDATRRASLVTKIAVDWLSNLLFVLDKYRLSVVDFNGNNELLLIDNFNAITRPIDMKVDPVNNFLFWLQMGRFHNTIYKLDLSVLSMPTATQRLVGNTLKLRQSGTRTKVANMYGNNVYNNDSENVETKHSSIGFDSSDLIALVSHHYAHPIITNLPRHTRLFTIDHKHSRIYVPLSPTTVATAAEQAPAQKPTDQQGEQFSAGPSKRDDAEVFALSEDSTTHLNITGGEQISQFADNCTVFTAAKSLAYGQILAYNLDGTDVGPLRTAGAEGSHISSLDDIQDFTLDTKNNLLYWLTNKGQEMFEEYQEGQTIQPAQHNLDGKSYLKLIHFDSFNQPRAQKPRYNLRKIIQTLASSLSPNRWIRSDVQEQLLDDNARASSLNVRQRSDGSDASRFSRNAPYIILGVTCLIVITVYLIYTLIFQQMSGRTENGNQHCGNESMDSGSISESERVARASSFLSPAGWPPAPSGPSVRSTEASTFNRDLNSTQMGAYDLESSNYEASNAIDEHYRDSTTNQSNYCDENQSSLGLDSPKLADIGAWPTRTLDVFNKLYVPVELLQDEALLSIPRISMNQLEIERKTPLGEGHFGTVLQGKVRCTKHERASFLNKTYENHLGENQRLNLITPAVVGSSSTSSGHGSSSSTSGEFITANSCTEATSITNGGDDYLTPKTQLNSETSDYGMQNITGAAGSSCETDFIKPIDQSQTEIRVAIKKLKENASFEEKRDFLQEAKLLANFEHPNIVQLVGICLDRGSTLIVMELMLGGDLIRYMQENTPRTTLEESEQLTYDDLLNICLDIVNACCYLEDLDYIHRDLAARNCLVSSKKRSERVVKLADFGLARDIYKDSYYKKLNDSAMPLKWMAPECLIEQKFTKKSDVWSFGVVMWEVMGYCQQKPYGGVEPFFMKEYLAGGERLRKPDSCDEDMYRLMRQCWQMEPDRRPTFNECRAILIEIRNSKATL